MTVLRPARRYASAPKKVLSVSSGGDFLVRKIFSKILRIIKKRAERVLRKRSGQNALMQEPEPYKMGCLSGFEPELRGPQPLVLPLHHRHRE